MAASLITCAYQGIMLQSAYLLGTNQRERMLITLLTETAPGGHHLQIADDARMPTNLLITQHTSLPMKCTLHRGKECSLLVGFCQYSLEKGGQGDRKRWSQPSHSTGPISVITH